jgi:hypothetical protein
MKCTECGKVIHKRGATAIFYHKRGYVELPFCRSEHRDKYVSEYKLTPEEERQLARG